MPIKLQKGFPVGTLLTEENIFALTDERAEHQDIRPLKILILNLMPNKETTELQLLRLISQSPVQIEVDFLRMSDHVVKNTSMSHLQKFYLTFQQVEAAFYDGLIITGAPIEKLPFEEVDYWDELKKVMTWSQRQVTSVIHICWGAQAGLYHHYGIHKTAYEQKLFGVYAQEMVQPHRVCRGFDDVFYGPQSRYTGIDDSKIGEANLQVIAASAVIGPTILAGTKDRNLFLLGHFEYDTNSLKDEYLRDQKVGIKTAIPENYFIDNDPNGKISNNWRAHAQLFFQNWLNDVYQLTPYDLQEIPELNQKIQAAK